MESCLRGRICENLNAEVATGTVNTLVDAVGYLMWTFFARRVRANPSYYGATSGGDSDVETFLFSVAKDTLRKLREHSCIESEGIGDDIHGDMRATCLGVAGSEYYLKHQTPKQIDFGLRESAKIIQREINLDPTGSKSREQNLSVEPHIHPISSSRRIDEVSVAWLLYTLACTHEFDELPVRHNEEFLNEELSKQLMWGPDVSAILSQDGKSSYINPEVYADPHTK